MILLYLVGPPGVGKTTIMSELTSGLDRETVLDPFAHDVLRRGGRRVGTEMGRRREAYSGTDALSMSVQPRAVDWISTRPDEIVLAEGARLANRGFLLAARDAGYRVLLVYLHAPPPTLVIRRKIRGSDQNPQWIKGATTRATRIAETMELEIDVRRISAGHPVLAAEEIIALDRRLEALCSI